MFYSFSNHQWRYNKILLSSIINLINLSSTNYHFLTTFLTTSVTIGTFVHYRIYCMTLTPIRVHLHSHLLLHACISSRDHLIFIISWNVLLTPQMTPFLSMILVLLLALRHSSLTSLTMSNAALLIGISQRSMK